MAHSLLFGLDHSNHVFDLKHSQSFGKNIFTNAFPIALTQYLDYLGYGPICIEAVNEGGHLSTRQIEKPLEELIGCDPTDAYWSFESSYSEYKTFATGDPNRSDIVIADGSTTAYKHTSALEVKLVTVPNSATANKPRESQSCELVTRPPTIEQLCFSIARSFGWQRRQDICDIISKELNNPMDYKWSDEPFMLAHLPKVVRAAESVAREGIDSQHSFVLMAIWRTKGQAPVLDDECFDSFIWTDMAFLQLFTNSAKNDTARIQRPARSVIWLVKALFDYGAQGKVTFDKTRSDITFGTQTDKAGSFSGPNIMRFLDTNTFQHPRIPGKEYRKIIDPAAINLLMPERRLDGVLATAKVLEDMGAIE